MNLRLGVHGHHVNLDPRVLSPLQSLVSTHHRLLAVEGLNDYTDEELHEEHADDDNEDHCVDDHEGVVVLDWLLVGAHSIH